MKRIITFSYLCAFALASSYKIVPISGDGVALSGSNIAKSYSADAAIYNPANMAFLGDRPQAFFSSSFYHVGSTRFENQMKEPKSVLSTMSYHPDAYLNASDAKSKNFNFSLNAGALVYPLNERNFLGFAIYTDMAAVYGWDTPYGKMMLDYFDLRSGTAALSYAYRLSEDLSLGVALTLNHAVLKLAANKDESLNARYFGNIRKCTEDNTCTANDVVNAIYKNKPSDTYANDKFKITKLVPHSVYHGKFRGDNGYRLGYKLSATYSPSALDHQLNLSVVYSSKYKSHFDGNFQADMKRWSMFDFLGMASLKNSYPGLMKHISFPGGSGEIDPVAVMEFLANGMTDENNVFAVDLPTKLTWYNPASISLSASYSYGRHDFLFSYAHTFWSKVNNFKIRFKALPKIIPNEPNTVLQYGFANMLTFPLKINWHDTDMFAIGYRYNGDKWSFMAGAMTEDTPLDRREMTFLSKDARIYQLSFGAEYKAYENLSFQLSFAHQMYADVTTGLVDDILVKSQGKFYDQTNEILTAGIKYRF